MVVVEHIDFQTNQQTGALINSPSVVDFEEFNTEEQSNKSDTSYVNLSTIIQNSIHSLQNRQQYQPQDSNANVLKC